MLSRALALPAVLCVVAGLALGVWGWGQRDDARSRILPDEQVVEGDGFFAPAGLEGRVAEACQVLLLASRVQVPSAGTPLSGATPSSALASPTATAGLLLVILDPSVVGGIPSLDRADVRAAIVAERREVERVQAEGTDPAADPGVVAAARDLGQVLAATC